jgi:hypothetical protein
LQVGTEGWLGVALALLLPGFILAQTMPGTASSQAAAASASRAAGSGSPSTGGVSAPAGYVLSPTDQVTIEVFGEDDLRTNGRLNPEGNLSVPLLGSIHLAGLTLTQAVSKLTSTRGDRVGWRIYAHCLAGKNNRATTERQRRPDFQG